MRSPRRRLGFERAGAVPAARLGLPARRVRELTLVQAWERVAGEALARNAPARGLVRGVLEVVASDRRWFDAIQPLLPQMVARLAVEEPTLGVKKFRLFLSGEPETPEAILVPEWIGRDETPPSSRAPRQRARPLAPADERDTDPADLQRRVERLAARYVERGSRQKP